MTDRGQDAEVPGTAPSGGDRRTVTAPPEGRPAGPGAGPPRAPQIDLRVDFEEELAPFASEFLVVVGPRGEILGGTGRHPLGYDWHRRVGHHIAEHAHPDDLPRIYDVIERARRTPGFDERLRVRARDGDGAWHVFDVRAFDARPRSSLNGAVLRLRDVTDEAGEATPPAAGDAALAGAPPVPAAGEADRFSSLAEMLPLGILSADVRGWVTYANAAAGTVLARPVEALLGEGWTGAVVDDDRPPVVAAAATALRTGTPCSATFRLAGAGPGPGDAGEGRTRWGHVRFSPLAVAGGGPTGWIATVEDVTERHRAEAALAHQATHDPLTGLPNRVLLEDRLHQAGERLRRGLSSVAVLFIDLDGFKDVNDRHGHQVGDVVLGEVARRLQRTVRRMDTVARFGGDEFVAVCESPPGDDAAAVVARITEALRPPVVVDGVSLEVAASVGVAVATDGDADMAELLRRADQAMYREKVRRGGPAGG